VELSNKPKLVITEKLKKQIDFLHSSVGSTEWSGELITREEGQITDLDQWTIYAEDIFLADIGSSTFTGYEVDKGGFKAVDIIEMYDSFPELFDGEKKIQHIHTHHSMGCFFSGTDWENLEERADISNYFMMLIVNFKGDYCAKVAYKAKLKSGGKEIIEFANNQDGFGTLTLNSGREEKEVLIVMNCDVEIPNSESGSVDYKLVDKYKKVAELLKDCKEDEEAEKYKTKAESLSQVDLGFITRYNHVKEAIQEEKDKKTSNSNEKGYISSKDYKNSQGYLPFREDYYPKRGGLIEEDYEDFNSYKGGNWSWGDDWSEEMGKGRKKDKKLSEMTDKEFNDFENGREKLKFSDKDVCAVLNAALTEIWHPLDFSNPMKGIVEQDGKVKNRRKFAEDLIFAIRTSFDIIYPQGTDEDYLNLLEVMQNKLEKYKNCRLVSIIIEEVVAEMLEIKELIED